MNGPLPSPLASVWAWLQADPRDPAARANWQELQAAGASEAAACFQAFDAGAYAVLTRGAMAGAEVEIGMTVQQRGQRAGQLQPVPLVLGPVRDEHHDGIGREKVATGNPFSATVCRARRISQAVHRIFLQAAGAITASMLKHGRKKARCVLREGRRLRFWPARAGRSPARDLGLFSAARLDDSPAMKPTRPASSSGAVAA